MNKPSPSRLRRRGGTEEIGRDASIRIIGDHVAVNGRSLHVDYDQDVYAAAIAEVARCAARPRGRAVRTVATADGRSTVLLIHPDGRAELLDEQQGAATLDRGAAAAVADPTTRPDRLPRPRPPRRGAAAAAAAALVTAVAITGTTMLRDDATDTGDNLAPAAISSPSAAPHIPPPAAEPAGPVATPVPRNLRARARTTDSGHLVLTINVSGRPARVTIRATPLPSSTSAGGPRGGSRQSRERSIVVPRDTRALRLVLRDLAAGPWQWKVSSPRASSVRGRARIADQLPNPTTELIPETSSPAPTSPTPTFPTPTLPTPTLPPSQQPTKPPPPVPVDPNQNPLPG
jgi:hypothetical protein